MTTRINTIASLKAKREALQSELNQFAATSKAARAAELRDEIARLSVRIDMHEKRLAKETVIDNATGEVETTKSEAFENLRTAYERFAELCGVKSGRRQMVAWIGSLLAAFCTGAIIGKITELLILSALSATGSMFLAVLIYIIGFIVGIYSGVKIGGAVFTYIAEGTVDKHWQSLKSGVVSFFKPTLVAPTKAA